MHVDRMKPSPYLLEQAAAVLRVDPRQTVLIGDQVSDVKAAITAGAASVGYANKPGKSADLGGAGADSDVEDMNVLAAAVAEAS